MKLHIEECLDRSAWELFVLQNAPHSLFQSWIWGEVQKRTGNNVYRFGLFLDDTLVGVAQTVIVHARRGSFLHVRHGPICSTLNVTHWKFFITKLKEFAIQHHCLFVRISPLLSNDDTSTHLFSSLHAIPSAIHRMDGEHCWILDINRSEDQLLSSMRKTTRYEIRKAIKDGAHVFSTTNPKFLSDFFTLYKETSKRHDFVPHSGIKEEFEVFVKERQGLLFLGSFKNTVTASAIVLFYGNQAIYHHGASIHAETPVSARVQWEAIREARKRGMKHYNFWGIAPEQGPNHPWRGITLFKKGFGGREMIYAHAQDIPVSPLYIVPRAIESVRRWLKGYD